MGMYDESWCASCGTGMTYTPDEDANCGTCEKSFAVDFIEGMIAYVENLKNEKEYEWSESQTETSNSIFIEGQLEAIITIHAELVDRYQNA